MLYKLVLLFVFFGLLILFSSFRKDKRKRIIFFGDSLTERGTEPTGYITVIKHMLQDKGFDNYKLINAGIGGNKVSDLYSRIEGDVISKSPEVVVLFVGVNDVWHKRTHGTGTAAGTFEELYHAIIRRLQITGIKVILCTPTVIGERTIGTNEQDDDLDVYANIVRNIGSKLHLPVCDVRTLFRNYIEVQNITDAENGVLTIDGVHLNEIGNRLVAEAIWEKIGTLK